MRQYSLEYQKFKSFLGDFNNQIAEENKAIIVLQKHEKLLNNKGVILVNQANVRKIQQALKHFNEAMMAIDSVRALLAGFDDLNFAELNEVSYCLQDYESVLTSIVNKAFARRLAAMGGENAI